MRSSTKLEDPPRRGRPREFDPERVLDRAMRVFHRRGYSAASLDELATAMGMNRPSIYNAFGDKETLYRRSMERFLDGMRAAAGVALDAPRLGEGLERFYTEALGVYFDGESPLGCFVFCTAPAESVSHPEIAGDMERAIGELDSVLERRFRRAQAEGEFPAHASCRDAARLAQALLHSLALRARAGESRRSLGRLVRSALPSLCGAAP